MNFMMVMMDDSIKAARDQMQAFLELSMSIDGLNRDETSKRCPQCCENLGAAILNSPILISVFAAIQVQLEKDLNRG